MLKTNGRDRGATLPIVALLLPVIILMTAFAIDLGRQRSSRRTMQARADIIALDLLRLADGRTEDQIIAGDPTHPSAENALVTSAARNDVARSQITLVEWGTWDPARTPKFVETLDGLACPVTTIGCVPDAVRVTAEETTDYFFQPGSGDVSRTGLAAQRKFAGFSIGSYALALSSGGSTLLDSLIGSALGIGVLSYSGLATADFTYLDIATELGLGSPEELFDGSVSALDVIDASAEILRRGNPSSAQVAVLDTMLADGSTGLGGVAVTDVVDVDSGAEDAALSSTFNLYDFVAGSAFVANGANAVAIPAIGLGVPGFDLVGGLNIVQAPQTAWGTIGEDAETSQVDATLTSTVGTLALGNFSANTLNSIMPGARGAICSVLGFATDLLCGNPVQAVTAELRTTVTLDLASARGVISDIRCPAATEELDIDVNSELLMASIATTLTFKVGAATLGSFLVSVTNTRPATPTGFVDFVIPPDALNVFKPAAPGVGSLTGTTTLTGLGALGVLSNAVLNTALSAMVSSVNAGLVDPLAAALGARVASADVAARGIDCRNIALVG